MASLANQKPGSSQANQSDEENEDELSDQIKTEGGECKFQNDHKINITFGPSKKRNIRSKIYSHVLTNVNLNHQSRFYVAFSLSAKVTRVQSFLSFPVNQQ